MLSYVLPFLPQNFHHTDKTLSSLHLRPTYQGTTLLLKQSVIGLSLQCWCIIWRIWLNFQSTTVNLPSRHFFSLNSISSSLQRLFHIKHPTRCPRSSGPCPWIPSHGKGPTWAPTAHREPGAAKGLHTPPSLKACSLPSVALIHFSPWHTFVQN